MSLVCGQFLFAEEESPDSLVFSPDSSVEIKHSEQKPYSILHIIDWGASGLSYIMGGRHENITYGLGIGWEIPSNQEASVNDMEIFFLLRYDFLNWNNKKLFFGSKLGIGEYTLFNPFIGILFLFPDYPDYGFSLDLGYAFFQNDAAPFSGDVVLNDNHITFKVAMQFKTGLPSKKEYDIIRLGLGADIALWQSKNELNGCSTLDKCSSPTGGAGLFFRLYLAKWLYLQPGAYYHSRNFEKEITLSEFISGTGIDYIIPNFIGDNTIATITWNSSIIEVPILLGIGSGQFKFIFGLLWSHFLSGLDIGVSLATPLGDYELDEQKFEQMRIIEKSLDDKYYDINEYYFVAGLDIDIAKHFGIGGKFLIPASGNKLRAYSFRTSIYFIY